MAGRGGGGRRARPPARAGRSLPRARRRVRRRSQTDADLVAAVLGLLRLGVVGLPQPPGGALAPRNDLLLGDAALDQLLDDPRGPLLGELLVVRFVARGVGMSRDLELEVLHATGVELLLGVDQGGAKVLQLLVAVLVELVRVGLEGALVLATLLEELLVDGG